MPRVTGVLGEQILRKIISQLSNSITANTPPAERRKILENILSLREELHANSRINKQRREKDRQKKLQEQPQESPHSESKSEIDGKS